MPDPTTTVPPALVGRHESAKHATDVLRFRVEPPGVPARWPDAAESAGPALLISGTPDQLHERLRGALRATMPEVGGLRMDTAVGALAAALGVG